MGEMQIICVIILGLVVNECFKATSLKATKQKFFMYFCCLKLIPPSSFFTEQGCVVNETYYAVSTQSYSLQKYTFTEFTVQCF